MEYIIYDDIAGMRYRKLLDYLYTRCDAVSFFIQRYNEYSVTPNNYKIFEIENKRYNIGDHFFDHSYDEETFDYFHRLETVLKTYEPFYLREYQSTEYVRLITAHINDIKVIKFTPEVLALLKREYSLFSWGDYRSRTLPRDLSFFSDHKLVFTCNTMDEESYFYDDSDEMLKTLLINYCESDLPEMNITMDY